ncbi:phage protease [Sphingomonas floccifaciens]|uniref:Phage protease n=1 Tax=Sphingomonas floccifaciens TaxID=1844115 RepID=A0ABW4NCM9_9SPHN
MSPDPNPSIALCAANEIGHSGSIIPQWLHLIPSGAIRTNDGRGPYRLDNPQELIAASLGRGEKLVLDVNHATDLAAPKGGAAPAHGWIVELQSRNDGVWGRVDWVDPSAAMWRHYRGVSPVIAHKRDGAITKLLRASLTNLPNFSGLHSLHSARPSVKVAICAQELADRAIAFQSQMANADVHISIAEAVSAVETGSANTSGPSSIHSSLSTSEPVLSAKSLADRAIAYRSERMREGNYVSIAEAVTLCEAEWNARRATP